MTQKTKRQAHGKGVYHHLATKKNSTQKRTNQNPKPKRKNKRAEMFSVVIIAWEALHSSNMGVSST
jgi:hypothetical protein